jgi:hypothetical protein
MTDDVRSRVDAAGQVRRRTAVKADAHQPGRLPAAQDRRETPTSIFGCALPEPAHHCGCGLEKGDVNGR